MGFDEYCFINLNLFCIAESQEELEEGLKVLIIRNNELLDLLKKAGIEAPPFTGPKLLSCIVQVQNGEQIISSSTPQAATFETAAPINENNLNKLNTDRGKSQSDGDKPKSNAKGTNGVILHAKKDGRKKELVKKDSNRTDRNRIGKIRHSNIANLRKTDSLSFVRSLSLSLSACAHRESSPILSLSHTQSVPDQLGIWCSNSTNSVFSLLSSV